MSTGRQRDRKLTGTAQEGRFLMTRTSVEGAAGDEARGLRDPSRLAAVARAELEGHLGDPALNAIVATLRIGCRVPIAVVNVVSQDLQIYPAEVGVGAPCTTVPDDLSFCAAVVETRGPVMVSDAATHPTYSGNPLVRAGVVGSYAGFPLVDEGHVLGSVSIFDSRARVFTMDELGLLAHQARLASAVLALRRSVRTDALTGVPNRRSLLDRVRVALARAERQRDQVAVMHVDIDGFRDLSTTRGREVGDAVLIALTGRWRDALRPTDTLARVGDDDFVAVCGDLATSDQAVAIAERLAGATSEPVVAGGGPVALGVSIGIVVARGARQDPAQLLDAAETAMQRARATDGSSWHLAD